MKQEPKFDMTTPMHGSKSRVIPTPFLTLLSHSVLFCLSANIRHPESRRIGEAATRLRARTLASDSFCGSSPIAPIPVGRAAEFDLR